MDITGAARSVLLLAKPNPKEQSIFLAPVKSNLTALSPTLVFTVEDNRMFFEGTSDLSADDLLESTKAEYTQSKLEAAKEFLTGLFSHGNDIPAEKIYNFMRFQEVSKRTVDSAKKELGIKSVKTKDCWLWQWPK